MELVYSVSCMLFCDVETKYKHININNMKYVEHFSFIKLFQPRTSSVFDVKSESATLGAKRTHKVNRKLLNFKWNNNFILIAYLPSVIVHHLATKSNRYSSN